MEGRKGMGPVRKNLWENVILYLWEYRVQLTVRVIFACRFANGWLYKGN